MAEEQDILGAELAQKTNDEIAQALVAAPPQTDIARSGVQRQIIYTENNPGRWMTICWLALQEKGLTEERRIFLEIERINGNRRIKDADLIAIESFFNVLQKDIYALHTGEWKNRLLGLWAYHGGIVYESLGNYAKSAECHQMTADLGGDEFSFLCALHMAARARLLNAILNDTARDVLWQSFKSQARQLLFNIMEIVEDRGKRIKELPAAQCRWLGNIAMHISELQILADINLEFGSPLSNPLELLNMLPDEVQNIFLAPATLAQALEFDRNNNRVRLARAAFELSGRNGDVAAEALLVILQTYQNWILHGNSERWDDADQIARQIILLPGYGGHIPKKIAAEWLESRLGC